MKDQIIFGSKMIPITIENAKAYKMSDLFQLENESKQVVQIQVKDAPEIDEDESDVDF